MCTDKIKVDVERMKNNHVYLLNSRAVKDLRLEEDDRVRAAYTGQQQALGIRRATGHDYFKSRGVAEVSLRRLGVVVATVAHSTAGGADGQATAVELVA